MNSRFSFSFPGLLLCAGIVLVTLSGCSSSYTLQIDAVQPVYFGVTSAAVLPLDSAHVQTLKDIVIKTSHVSEKSKTVSNEHLSFEKSASEGVVGDAVAQVNDAMQNDPDRFIGNGGIRAEIEAYIPLDTILNDFIAGLFIKNATSEGTGEASSETIEIRGTVYRIRRDGR